jgi:GNAT superfamily N-acetyltransferase
VTLSIQTAGAADVGDITTLIGELLHEIMQTIGTQAFHFDPVETAQRLEDFLQQGKYVAFLARTSADASVEGVVCLCESQALYAEGRYGIIPEFYVRPEHRSGGVGARLLDTAKAYGRERGWKRLEVTTPPLPQFDRTLSFYTREGFSITGGRKLKLELLDLAE